tara:strand:- start:319 stop:1572 length:1254 start_codon:yes stop_codon:yes gene_type:complete
MSESARLYRGSLAPEEAVARLNAAARQVNATETVDLAAATGRYLYADLVAGHDLPATNNAAVDGYAVDAAFLAANPGHAFPVIGRAAAGHPFAGTAASGEAVRTFTGAVMPQGTDAVAMHEFCELEADGTHVTIGSKLTPGANNRPAGENLRKGETIIPAGTRLDAADLGIAAASGMATLEVRRQLKVGLVSMGDELVAPGDVPAHGQLHDSNRPMLADMLRGDGHEVEDFGIIADDEAALSSCFQTALSRCDAVLSSGGASDGDEDHTQAAMRNTNIEPAFWRLSIKPGRPMSAGLMDGKPVMCLPGNPVAAFVCYRLAAAPVLRHMAGGVARPVLKLRVRCGFAHRKSAGRAEYLRVRIIAGADGEPEMVLHGRKGAGVLSSLTGADGLIEIPVYNEGVEAGDYLSFIPFRETGL